MLIVGGAWLAVAAATIYGYAWNSNQAEDNAVRRMTQQSERAATSVSDSVALAKRSVEGLAAQPGIDGLFASGATCQLTAEGTDAFPSLRLDLVAPGGDIVCSSKPKIAAAASGTHKSTGWLSDALHSSKAVVSWEALDGATGQSAVAVGVSVRGSDGPVGTVAMLLHDRGAADALEHTYRGLRRTSVLMVHSETGEIVTASGVPATQLQKLRFEHSQRTGDWAGIDGTRQLFGSADIPGSGLRVYSGVSREAVLADARGSLAREAGIGVLALLILTFAAWLLNRRVARPLEVLTRAVARTGRGKDEERLRRYGTAEVAALADEFNKMLDVRAGHEAQLVFQATHDPMTGLPNRTLLRERLDHALSDPHLTVAVLWLGIDRLDNVNDSFGHAVGERVLVEVTERLAGVLSPGETLARLGSDQVVVVSTTVGPADSQGVAERLRASFDQPFAGPDGNIVLRGFIGIADAGDGPANPDHLLRQADSAMREAKSTRHQTVRFDRALQLRATKRLDVESALRQAIQANEFVVYYQPLLELSSGEIIGAEALVRWQHPERGLVSPIDFIPIAEQTGQIVEIGQIVLAVACRKAATWHAAGHPLRIAVNVAVEQLHDDSFPAHVAQVLSETGLPGSALCLEITETSLMSNEGSAARAMVTLRELGIQLAIDDFGTGYSSLSYLHEMPVDELKIDRSFINGLGKDERDVHLVGAVVGMARALEIGVVAEGIETEEQHDLLRSLGCNAGQGYLFAAPQPAYAFDALLAKQQRARVSVAA